MQVFITCRFLTFSDVGLESVDRDVGSSLAASGPA